MSTRRSVRDKVLPIESGTRQLLLEVNLSRLVSLNRTGVHFPPAVPLVWAGANAARAWFVSPTHQQTDSDRSKRCSVKKATRCRVFAFGPDQMKQTTDVKVA